MTQDDHEMKVRHMCFVVKTCAIFLHSKNGVFSPMLAMYNGYHSSEFFRRNDSVHLLVFVLA